MWLMRNVLVCSIAWVLFGCGARSGLDDGGGKLPSPPSIDPSSIESARPVAPLSTATTATRTPTLRWVLPTGTDGAEIELCADRACATSLAKIQATGSSMRLASPLAARVVFWRLRGVHAGVVGTRTSATWELFTSARDAHDAAWGSAPDFDGDGIADWALGAFAANDDAGKVEVFTGKHGAIASSPTVVLDGDAGSEFGGVFASIGDIDGDGFPELAVSSQLALSIYAGGPGGIGAKPVAVLSDAPVEALGSAGDVDGDGYGDFYSAQVGSSEVVIHYGGPKGTNRSTAFPSPIASDVTYATSGDLDGDGRPDLCMGFVETSHVAPRVVRVRVAMGRGASIDVPAEAAPAFLAHVGCGGDVDGDGFADLVVSYVGTSDQSDLVDVFRGGPNGFASAAVQTKFPMEYGMDATEKGPPITFGDFDGDGCDDLVAGLVGRRLQIVPGSASGLDLSQMRLLALPNTPQDPYAIVLAPSVANGGDIDGDGVVDLVSGAQGYWEGESPNQIVADVGHVWVFAGNAQGIDASSTPLLELAGPGDDQLTFGCDVQ
jgi:hypothetical protein